MNCPHCSYEPDINQFDYAAGAGRFFALGIEMTQEANPHSKYGDTREPVFGCPECGTLFMWRGYAK